MRDADYRRWFFSEQNRQCDRPVPVVSEAVLHSFLAPRTLASARSLPVMCVIDWHSLGSPLQVTCTPEIANVHTRRKIEQGSRKS
jgi:hypothetical protein